MELWQAVVLDPLLDMIDAPEFLAEVVIGGLTSGVMYSLVAFGFASIFKASGVFNFAQRVLALFAALTLVGLMTGTVPILLTEVPGMAMPPWLAIIITIFVMIGMAFLVERIILRPLVNQDPIIMFMSTIGLAFVLEGAGDILWGSEVKTLDIGIPSGTFMWSDIQFSVFDLWDDPYWHEHFSGGTLQVRSPDGAGRRRDRLS